MLPAYMFGTLGVLLVLMGGWLLITGRNFPGWLGRGFTEGDRIRMQRAPAQFWRTAGAICFITGFFGLVTALFAATYPAPSRVGILIVTGVVALMLFALTPLAARLILLAARYRLFRWDKP